METHEFIKELVAAGLTEQQAEIIARHQTKVIHDNVATKKDLEVLEYRFTIKFGAMLVGGLAATIGIILAVLPLLLQP